MKYKFYSPFIIWLGIWLFICFLVLIISGHSNRLYWQSSLARERWLAAGGVDGEFSRKFGFSRRPLDDYRFFPKIQQPPGPLEAKTPFSVFLDRETGELEGKPLAFFTPPSLLETVWNQQYWRQVWQSTAHASLSFNILSYLLFVVGFGAICLITAIYQNHFRRALEEQFQAAIEARNLRIQVLESSRDTLSLKLQLLDQEHAKAKAAAWEAQENIRDLEEKLQSEAERNEELQGELNKALQEENRALEVLRTLEEDRERIAAEQMGIATRLAEAEKTPEADPYRQKVRKAKGRLRLNAVWLTALYKNLSFSPRAWQNLHEVQNVPEVFPSLPDALAKLNNVSLEALLSGETLPPKTVARFTTQELDHFQGPLWEYRFSADGRIFFGLSRSRTWSIDTILLKRRFPDKKEKYDRYLAATLGKDNQDLQPELIS